MNKPIPAYNGADPYVFVCYAHTDSDAVYADLVALAEHGINVWYDEGIPAGAAWRGEIAGAIKGASKFLFFISNASLHSNHCLREIDYALNHDIDIVPIYLDKATLPAELDLVLNRVQALFRYSDARYMEHLVAALQESTRLAPLVLVKKFPGFRVGLLAVAVGGGLLLAIWSQQNASTTTGVNDSSLVALPNAFDSYLEGLELVERWDKDDNLDRAIALFRDAINTDPEFALAFARLSMALRIKYSLSGDETWLDAATEAANAAVQLKPNLAPVQVALGRIHYSRGNYDLALAALEQALSIDANDALANHALGALYARLGRQGDAEAAYQRAIALDPDDPTVHDAYASFLLNQGRFDEAGREWQTVIRIAPDHYAALVNLGAVLNETGRISEAITMYERAISIRPSYMAYANLGTAYSRGERYGDSVEAYLQALELDDSDWLAWGNLAYVYSWMDGREELAAAAFQRAIELAEDARRQNPRDPFVNSDLALYYAKTGQTVLAEQRLETAIALAPDASEILAAAAEAYELIDQRDRAVELALKSIETGFSQEKFLRNPEFTALLADPRMQTLL